MFLPRRRVWAGWLNLTRLLLQVRSTQLCPNCTWPSDLSKELEYIGWGKLGRGGLYLFGCEEAIIHTLWRLSSMVAFRSPLLLSITLYPCSVSKPDKLICSFEHSKELNICLSLEPYEVFNKIIVTTDGKTIHVWRLRWLDVLRMGKKSGNFIQITNVSVNYLRYVKDKTYRWYRWS